MSSDPATRVYPLIPSDTSTSAKPEQHVNNLVTLETVRQPEQQQLLQRLEQLIGQLEARGDDVELQLETLQPVTEAIADLAVDLGMRGEDLEGALAEVENRVEQLDAARLSLIAQTQGLSSMTDHLRTGQVKLSDLLRSLTDRLDQNVSRQQAVLNRLQDRTSVLDQTDEGLGQEIEAERQRLDDLDPRVSVLEKESARLDRNSREAAGETGLLGRFVRRLAWSTGIFALLAVIALGALSYNAGQHGQAIERVLSAIGIQQQQLDTLQGVFDSLGQNVADLAYRLDSLYQAMSEKDALLDQRLDEVNRGVVQVSDQVASIQQRLDAPEEPLASGAFDLSGLKKEQWLLEQAPEHYTVQIVGVYGQNAMANFIGRYRQQLDLEQLVVVRILRQGRDWFVLLQGEYAAAADASGAAEALPTVLQKNGPYVRMVESLQQQVRYRQGLQAN